MKTYISKGILFKPQLIEKLKLAFSIEIPAEYYSFLEKTNGGYPEIQKNFNVKYKDEIYKYNISLFDGSEEFFRLNDLLLKNQNEDKLENQGASIIIGATDYRDLILIGIKEDNFGKIYFSPSIENVFDYIEDCDAEPIYPVIEIAPDFNTFMNSLQPDPES